MTGRVGNRRSVSFPIINGEASAQEQPVYVVSQLVVYQNLKRDALLLLEKVKALGCDENGVHGELQVLVSANRRIGAGLELLLAVEEGEGLKAHSAGGSQ